MADLADNVPNMSSQEAGNSVAERAPPPFIPEHFHVANRYKKGVKRVKVDRWIKQEYHDREVERIWKKIWQYACREEEIPEVGDYTIYEIAELSFIVMRTAENEFKAYWNSCPHRARKLREFDGKRQTEIRCMFHGWSWNIDGTVKDIPCKWDFPGTEEDVKLPQAKVGTWGGFVFINPDLDCEPLEDFLGTMPQHFEGADHDFSKRWKQVHVAAVVDANWKVCQEAFIEGWHVNTTHPQLIFSAGTDRIRERWDGFGNWMRSAIDVTPLPEGEEPTPGWVVQARDEQEALDSHFDRHLNEPVEYSAEGNHVAHDVIVQFERDLIGAAIGEKVNDYGDVDIRGDAMVHLFPNFHPWGGFSQLVYRFRPYRNDPHKSIMDVLLLARWPEDTPRPPPTPVHWLQEGETMMDAPELGRLARIFMQDMANMPRVQEGLRSSGRGYVVLSDHNEAPVRHLHDVYEEWMGLGDGE